MSEYFKRKSELTSSSSKNSESLNLEEESEDLEYSNGFFERMKKHRFWLVRVLFYIVYSIWLVVVFIGMIIAWIFTWILL